MGAVTPPSRTCNRPHLQVPNEINEHIRQLGRTARRAFTTRRSRVIPICERATASESTGRLAFGIDTVSAGNPFVPDTPKRPQVAFVAHRTRERALGDRRATHRRRGRYMLPHAYSLCILSLTPAFASCPPPPMTPCKMPNTTSPRPTPGATPTSRPLCGSCVRTARGTASRPTYP